MERIGRFSWWRCVFTSERKSAGDQMGSGTVPELTGNRQLVKRGLHRRTISEPSWYVLRVAAWKRLLKEYICFDSSLNVCWKSIEILNIFRNFELPLKFTEPTHRVIQTSNQFRLYLPPKSYLPPLITQPTNQIKPKNTLSFSPKAATLDLAQPRATKNKSP